MQSEVSERAKMVDIIDLITELSVGTRFDTLGSGSAEKVNSDGRYRNRNEDYVLTEAVTLQFMPVSQQTVEARRGRQEPVVMPGLIGLPAGAEVTIYGKIHRKDTGAPLPYGKNQRVAAIFTDDFQISLRTDLRCEVKWYR